VVAPEAMKLHPFLRFCARTDLPGLHKQTLARHDARWQPESWRGLRAGVTAIQISRGGYERFIHNISLIRCEERLALAVVKPTAI
jgi:hypothetical protein